MYLQLHILVGRMVIYQVSNKICFKTFRLNLYDLQEKSYTFRYIPKKISVNDFTS